MTINSFKERIPSLIALFASSSTLICCALPALLVLLGAGAALANLVNIFPFFITLSKHKVSVSIIALITLGVAGLYTYKTYNLPCPADPNLGKKCMSTRRKSLYIYLFSVFVFVFATIFTYAIPRVL